MAKSPYVYGLIDPRNGQIFYVGKGRGSRLFQHVSAVRRGKADDSSKNQRIREILGAGLQVEHRVIETFKTDAEAVQEENRLLVSLPGLTNIAGPRQCNIECGISDKRRMERAAQKLLSRLMPFEKWVAQSTDFQKRCASLTGGSLRGWYDRLRDQLVKEATDATPNVFIQHSDGRVEESWEYSCA